MSTIKVPEIPVAQPIKGYRQAALEETRMRVLQAQAQDIIPHRLAIVDHQELVILLQAITDQEQEVLILEITDHEVAQVILHPEVAEAQASTEVVFQEVAHDHHLTHLEAADLQGAVPDQDRAAVAVHHEVAGNKYSCI